jgi:ribosomal protein S6 kinase alpha-5
MRKLVSAVNFMHNRGVVHRDLKPENLLYEDNSDDPEIKLVDFGFARLKPEHAGLTTPCFTLQYAAPEVLKRAIANEGQYDESCDLWSLGVIMYTMLSGRAPFQTSSRNASASKIMARIRGGAFTMSGAEWNSVSDQAKNIIKGLLTVDPKQRLTMHELRSNEWLKGRNTQVFSITPLCTPDVLSLTRSTVNAVQSQISVTMDAFHKAHREGFRLQDVTKAPLAQRRKMKKSSAEARSSSSDSSASYGSLTPTKGLSQSPMRNSPVRNLSSNSASSTQSMGFTPLVLPGKQPQLDNSGFFCFSGPRIASLMPTATQPKADTDCSDRLNANNNNEGSPRGSKRKLPVLKEDSDDDCVIIEENSSEPPRTDAINNNAKRPRSETIVIE